MSAGDNFENTLAKVIFQGATATGLWSGIFSTGTATRLAVGLHTADPGESGTQSTSEVSYSTTYSRQPVARTSTGWVVTGGVINPFVDIDFITSTGTATQNATHWSIGLATSGAGEIIVSGTLTPNIAISQNVTPSIDSTSTVNID